MEIIDFSNDKQMVNKEKFFLGNAADLSSSLIHTHLASAFIDSKKITEFFFANSSSILNQYLTAFLSILKNKNVINIKVQPYLVSLPHK